MKQVKGFNSFAFMGCGHPDKPVKRVNTSIQHPLTGESLVAKKRALKALAQYKYSTN